MIANNDKITVVVPIYNTEKYLRRCIDSIVKQSYRNIEIILVNDGSIDNSLDICKQYKKNDDRIIIISKENGGLSSARNAGIKIATGKYICFVDSDDYISDFFIEILYVGLENGKYKISQCAVQQFCEDVFWGNSKGVCDIKFDIVDKNIFLNNINKGSNTVACNKLYDKSLFKSCEYPEGRIHEDVATTYKLIDLVDKIAVTEEKLYYYYFNNESISKSKIKNNKIDLLRAYREQADYFRKKHYTELYANAANNFFACFGTYSTKKREEYFNKKEFIKVLTYYYLAQRSFLIQAPIKKGFKILALLSINSLLPISVFYFLKKKVKYDS